MRSLASLLGRTLSRIGHALTHAGWRLELWAYRPRTVQAPSSPPSSTSE